MMKIGDVKTLNDFGFSVLRVPGGWLYKFSSRTYSNDGGISIHTQFIPHIDESIGEYRKSMGIV